MSDGSGHNDEDCDGSFRAVRQNDQKGALALVCPLCGGWRRVENMSD